MRKILLLIIVFVTIVMCVSPYAAGGKYKGEKKATSDFSWHADILPGYEARYVDQGEAFDGPCRSTLVRKLAGKPTGKAYLYIHGFNDYFFQKEMGERFVDSGYNFYAVDLRRYGRSLEPWQYPFNVRDIKEYFADIDSALVQIRRDGNTDITLSGHSTGGLTTALYVAERGARCGVSRLVTDSPFLEWNYNAFYRKFLIPATGALGAIFKNVKIPQGHCDAYAFSLLKEYHGEWVYDTDWKMIYSPPVTMSWIRSIDRAHSRLMRSASHITVPVLVMHSSRGIKACGWSQECQTGDVVLDPAMLGKCGKKLGRNPDVCAIDSGLHDLVLSRPEVREAAYDTIFRFLRTR